MSRKYRYSAVNSSLKSGYKTPKSHYLFVSPNDSINLFPENTAQEFTVEFPSFIMDVSTITLMEFHCSNLHEPLLVFCDTVKSSHIKNSLLPVLRVVESVGEFGNQYAMESTRSDVIRLKFKITTLNLDFPSYGLEAVRLVLKITTGDSAV